MEEKINKVVTHDGKEYGLTDMATKQELAIEIERAKQAEKANADAIGTERERASAKEIELQKNIANEVQRATQAEQMIESNAAQIDSFNAVAKKGEVELHYKSLEYESCYFAIPAATETTAGVMSAEDKRSVEKSKNFVDYAVLTGGTPSMNTTSATFTLPKIFISAREKGLLQTTEDIVITQTDKSWSTQYIVLDISSEATRTVNSNKALVLGDKEVVIALLRWNIGVIEGNFTSYTLDGNVVELKPVTSFSTEIKNLKYYRDYAVITAQYPSMSTSNKQFIVPAGASIYSNRSKGHIVLENDIVYGLHNGAGYVYCILDVATLESRTTSVNTADFVLGENEVILAYVNMFVGVIHGYFSKYTLNGKGFL